MNGLININNGNPVVSSKDIADKFGKVHRDVLTAIRALDCSDDFRARNFTHSSYVSEQNKKLPCFSISRDGFAFLCMGFTGKAAAEWKEKYINAFNMMEKTLSNAPIVMQEINDITRRLECGKESASFSGRDLSNWGRIKKRLECDFKEAVNHAQLSLGFKDIK